MRIWNELAAELVGPETMAEIEANAVQESAAIDLATIERLETLVDTMIAHVESRAQATGSAELACLAQQLKEIKECS